MLADQSGELSAPLSFAFWLQRIKPYFAGYLSRWFKCIIAEQQRVADFYFDGKVISRKIDIKQGILPDLVYKAIVSETIK
ncbi:MAG: hypothetical protein V7K41_10000 [Nostoc sp.]|uniref:hypothetical protein n=1 Tax=Nostoc sp. TaxID=1180 RepID=UPI002FFC6A29